MFKRLLTALLLLPMVKTALSQTGFVTTRHHRFFLDHQPYYFIGANYWYGSLLGLQKDSSRGIERLRKELDFLRSKGVNNLRILGGAEGEGLIQSVQRVGPALQPQQGIFDTAKLTGLDILLNEMALRNMKAVLFLSNNWEWSGGFLQYMNWNGILPDSLLQNRMSWDRLRDEESRFYSCRPCIADYLKQVNTIISRKNTINGKKYTDDPTIMSWELVNEPRPMRPAAIPAYIQWATQTAAYIKSLDAHHLVTTGHEGYIGAEKMEVFKAVHRLKNIDYLTIHIWPKNWQWFQKDSMQEQLPQVFAKTTDYIQQHIAAAQLLQKPLVLEEFGLPRDQQSFSPASATTLRDQYYQHIFSYLIKSKSTSGVIAGANFWAFGGMARPISDQPFWKPGDDYMGDPPMEEQGLNTVFDNDAPTWKIIENTALAVHQPATDSTKQRKR